jgi:predicted ABC-type ATPase
MELVESATPHVVIIAGPNGAGKSTVAPKILRGTLAVKEFVNADVIARGLSAFEPERAALSAGKIMLLRLREDHAPAAQGVGEGTVEFRI